MERAFRRGLAAFRWGAWIWVAITLVVYWDTDYFRHRPAAMALLGAALILTVIQTALVPVAIRFENRRRVAGAELAVGIALMALDGYVRRSGVAFDAAPSIGGWWPVVGLLSAATYLPLWGSAIAGLSFGAARLLSVRLNHISFDSFTGSNWLSLLSTGLFAALAAMSVHGLMRLLRTAESEVATVRAREEVARTLHDGVLQTLAVVERRTDDPALAQLAREQERELRAFLFEQRTEGGEEELGSGLLAAAGRFENIFGGRVQVILAPDLPEINQDGVRALIGAAGEALTNAGKHGQAKMVTVYVEPADDGGVQCSVKDDGPGFDVEATSEGVGLSNSIRKRIAEVGGRVEIKSVSGNGVEVLLWVP